MRVTLLRTDGNTGKESLSTCEAGAFMERIKVETKERWVSGLRTMLAYTTGKEGGSYEHIDRLPASVPVWNWAGRARGNGD